MVAIDAGTTVRAASTTGGILERPLVPLRREAANDRLRLFTVDEAPDASALFAVRPPPLTEIPAETLDHRSVDAAAPCERRDEEPFRVFPTADAELLHPLADRLLGAAGAPRENVDRKATTVREESPLLLAAPPPA